MIELFAWIGAVCTFLSLFAGAIAAFASFFPKQAEKVAGFIEDAINAMYDDDAEEKR